jgi:DNA (cytosine-5)-methyltransferase 1
MSFSFVDLFAGIGGFHGALSAAGGNCVFASEIDADAARIYELNWGIPALSDINKVANDEVMEVPPHDVLAAGFPCQPFSKSGFQRGMDETRGTLFWNIAKIIEVCQPRIVLLENVRNLAGPRHQHEWEVIVKTLRDHRYRVSSEAWIISPHRIRPEFGGRPQFRERVFIAATREIRGVRSVAVPVPVLSDAYSDWDPMDWNLRKHLPLEPRSVANREPGARLSDQELMWMGAWEDFLLTMNRTLKGKPLPGFPFWVDAWIPIDQFRAQKGDPSWKIDILRKNSEFYSAHRRQLDAWLRRWNHLRDHPASRRKFEWQAQDCDSIWNGLTHLRPSGLRVKKATYAPALVAMAQTPIFGPQRRRITVREAARLQGFPDWFDFSDQKPQTSFKQLGNAVNIGVAYHALRSLVIRDLDLLIDTPELVKSILGSDIDPSSALSDRSNLHSTLTALDSSDIRLRIVSPNRMTRSS